MVGQCPVVGSKVEPGQFLKPESLVLCLKDEAFMVN
jgi:hypothetical protein